MITAGKRASGSKHSSNDSQLICRDYEAYDPSFRVQPRSSWTEHYLDTGQNSTGYTRSFVMQKFLREHDFHVPDFIQHMLIFWFFDSQLGNSSENCCTTA